MRMRVDVQKFQDYGDIYKYLIVPLWHTREKDLADFLDIKDDDQFHGFVMENISNYLSGKRPDDAVLGAVMNVADQYVAGGDVTLRAGDYIAFQRQYRQTAAQRG